MFSFMRKWAVSPGYADIANLRKYSQISAGISHAFGGFGALLSKRAPGVALGKSGGLPVVNFKICPDFLKRIFSCNKGSIMGNMSNLARFSEYAYNNYNGTYEKCWKEGKKEESFLEVRGASLRQGILSLRSAVFLKNGRSLDGAEHRGMTLESYFHSNGRSLDGAEHRGMTLEKGNVILSGVLTERRIQQHRRCCSFRWNEWILRRGLRMTRERLEQFKQLLATKQLSETITTVVA